MKNFIKKGLLLSVFAFLGLLILSPSAEAKRGCCSWHGGVSYCASNGRYVCNDGTYSPSCTCSSNSSYNSYNNYNSYNSYSSYTPSYNYNTPTCTSLYGRGAKENWNGTCSCKYGYTRGVDSFGKSKCVDGDTYCSDLYGWNSEFNDDTKSCQCKKSYYYNKSKGTCQSIDSLCKEVFGYGAEYDEENVCKCSWGYEFDGEKCV